MIDDHRRGSFYGIALRSRDFGPFFLTERQYSPRTATPVHAHERALLCLVLDGAYEERHCRKVFACPRATTVFHAAREEHLERFAACGARSLIIELDTPWMEHTLQTAGAGRHSLVAHDGGVLRPIPAKLLTEFLRDDPESALMMGGLLAEILGELFRLERRESRRPAWLDRAAELIQDTFPERLTLEKIAAEVNVHPVHLAQSFRRFHGCTVGDYLLRLRIEYACEQLARSDMPLIQIAITAGFADQSHFTRTFRRAVGVTPSEYRAARPQIRLH
jgi:AraC family transcriptional regulator